MNQQVDDVCGAEERDVTATVDIAIVKLVSLPSLESSAPALTGFKGVRGVLCTARTRRSRPWLWLNVVGQQDLVLREHRPLYSFNP